MGKLLLSFERRFEVDCTNLGHFSMWNFYSVAEIYYEQKLQLILNNLSVMHSNNIVGIGDSSYINSYLSANWEECFLLFLSIAIFFLLWFYVPDDFANFLRCLGS